MVFLFVVLYLIMWSNEKKENSTIYNKQKELWKEETKNQMY